MKILFIRFLYFRKNKLVRLGHQVPLYVFGPEEGRTNFLSNVGNKINNNNNNNNKCII